MSQEKLYTGFAKRKQFQSGGEIISLSFGRDDYNKLQNYFNERGYLNIDLKFTRQGKPYMEINTYGLNVAPATQAPIVAPAQPDEEDLPI